jgi:hypothetical protein
MGFVEEDKICNLILHPNHGCTGCIVVEYDEEFMVEILRQYSQIEYRMMMK